MQTRFRIRPILCSAAISLSLAVPLTAQTRSGDAGSRGQTTRNNRTVPDDQQRPPDKEPPDNEEMMRQTLGDLSRQIAVLAEELRKLRRQGERSTGIMELLLSEERLTRVEDKIDAALDQKAQLDQRELELQRRMKNIQAELLFRGAVRRDEAEAAIRADLQRALDEVHNQQSVNRQRVAELQTQADRLRQRVDELRKKLEPVETKEQ
jgi:ATP-dependent Lon protease